MKYLCIALIRFYRKYLSRLKGSPTCRFTPTCSAYALEAYQKRGFFAGTLITFLRILRCNPYSAGGYDPVPDHGLRTRAIRAEVSLAYRDDGSGDDIPCEVGADGHTVGTDNSCDSINSTNSCDSCDSPRRENGANDELSSREEKNARDGDAPAEEKNT